MRSTFVLTLLASVSGAPDDHPLIMRPVQLPQPSSRLNTLLPAGFNTPSGAFATFGNAQAKEFIRLWQPQPLKVPEGTALLPSSTENMKRYVRARILLEDAGVGCIASFDDGLCVFLCRFTKAEHSLLLPLWQARRPVRSMSLCRSPPPPLPTPPTLSKNNLSHS